MRAALERLGGLEAAEAWEERGRELTDAAAELGARNRQERRIAAVAQAAAAAEQLGARAMRGDGGRYVRQLAQRRARDDAWLERHRQRCQDRGQQPSPLIGRHVWAAAADVLSDPSGRAARIYLSRCGNRVAVGALLQAATGCDAAGTARRDLRSERARRIIAFGLCLLSLAKVAKRKGRYSGFVSGVTRGALLSLLRDPWTGREPHPNTLSGVHRVGAERDPGSAQLGYLPALVLAGFCYRQQLPPDACESFERFGEWASNRYWIVTAEPSSAHLEAAVRARLRALELLGGLLLDSSAPAPSSPAPSSSSAREAPS